jgi:hypothetical protein
LLCQARDDETRELIRWNGHRPLLTGIKVP